MGVFSAVSRISQHSTARYSFYLVSLYCTAELFAHHVYDWSSASGPSMYPALPSEPHNVIINQRYRFGRGCKVGDIIQFQHPLLPNQRSGKRILGMPGDYVVVDNNLSVSVGGAKGPWMIQEEMEQQREEPKMIQVPEGHVWVVGDNLRFSRDSRLYGPVPMALITGKIEWNILNWLDFKSFRGDNMIPVPLEEVD